jgi:hypothetical protein
MRRNGTFSGKSRGLQPAYASNLASSWLTFYDVIRTYWYYVSRHSLALVFKTGGCLKRRLAGATWAPYFIAARSDLGLS